jgi:hypothetical protein
VHADVRRAVRPHAVPVEEDPRLRRHAERHQPTPGQHGHPGARELSRRVRGGVRREQHDVDSLVVRRGPGGPDPDVEAPPAQPPRGRPVAARGLGAGEQHRAVSRGGRRGGVRVRADGGERRADEPGDVRAEHIREVGLHPVERRTGCRHVRDRGLPAARAGARAVPAVTQQSARRQPRGAGVPGRVEPGPQGREQRASTVTVTVTVTVAAVAGHPRVRGPEPAPRERPHPPRHLGARPGVPREGPVERGGQSRVARRRGRPRRARRHQRRHVLGPRARDGSQRGAGGGHRVVRLGVPRPGAHGGERQPGRQRLDHRVGDHAVQRQPFDVGRPAGERAEEQPGAVEVVHREVVPEHDPSLERLRRVEHVLPGDRADHDVPPGPQDPRVHGQRGGEGVAVRRGAAAGVVGGTDGHRPVQPVRQQEGVAEPARRVAVGAAAAGLTRSVDGDVVGVRQVVGHVVEEQPDVIDPGRTDLRRLRRERHVLGVVRVAHGQTRRDRPHEGHPGRGSARGQRAEPRELDVGVRLAPPLAVPRVVLGGVEVGVQPERRRGLEQGEPLVVPPRRPVEPLDDAGGQPGTAFREWGGQACGSERSSSTRHVPHATRAERAMSIHAHMCADAQNRTPRSASARRSGARYGIDCSVRWPDGTAPSTTNPRDDARGAR